MSAPAPATAVPLARPLLAFTVLGAGIVGLGMARGALPAAQGWLALVTGAVELVAAVVALRGVPRRAATDAATLAAAGTLAGAGVLGVVLAFAPGGRFGAAAAAAAGLQLAAAAGLGALGRHRAARHRSPAAQPRGRASVAGAVRRPGPALVILFAGAVAVSTVATAGLADTEAGAHAVPHGEHHLPDLPGLPAHHHGP
ncbi:hypothetical protein [Isoptericola sp. BMS4]|uniref:hypothetical protein n=1 Tax=Isoptericola sp. BMS4 TaxID=2527875 RepID=UPI001422E20C|nr:hypothetical protein [Isoptericola sp. BMS4]